jgi:AraC-like DNA-binding protein
MTSIETPQIDRLSALLERFRVKAQLFHSGPLCGVSKFSAEPGRGFLHILRAGELVITHQAKAGVAKRIEVNEPTMIFYPQPLAHNFHNAPSEGSDFTCASLDFEGGHTHPLVRALPPLIVLPMREVDGISESLALLFAEAGRVSCGHRLLADRLFEVVLLQMLRWLLDHPEQGGVSDGLLAGLCDTRLSRTLTAIHEDPRSVWSLERMAETAGMSRSSFAVRFKKTLGVTPADYLSDWRISIAKSLLHSGKSVQLIADQLSYANASAFSRLFAQRVGMSPRAWMDQNSR